MKLKNLKIYLLIIFSIFLFNLNTQAIDLNIQSPIPGNFFKNAQLPGNKKIIIQTILDAIDTTSFSDTQFKNRFKTDFMNMRNNLNETNILDCATYIYTINNEIYQSMFIQFQKPQPIPVFLRSKYKPIVINITTSFPDDFFKNIKVNNQKSTLKILKNFIPLNDQSNLDLFNTLITDEKNFYIEETIDFYDAKNKRNQCVLISHGTSFHFFNFQSYLPSKTLKASK